MQVEHLVYKRLEGGLSRAPGYTVEDLCLGVPQAGWASGASIVSVSRKRMTSKACIGRPLVMPRAVDCQDNGCIVPEMHERKASRAEVNGIQVRKTVTWQISQAGLEA